MTTVAFTALIAPHGEGRGRAVTVGKGSRASARIITPPATRRWRCQFAELAAPYRPAEPYLLGTPLAVEVVAVFERPAYASRLSKREPGKLLGGHTAWRYPHTAKPDSDNVGKAVLDALSDWWGDDSQVSDLTVTKRVAALGEEPSVSVRVSPLRLRPVNQEDNR